LAETLKDKLVEVQAVVNLITTTSRLYEGAGPGEDDEQEPFRSHDKL